MLREFYFYKTPLKSIAALSEVYLCGSLLNTNETLTELSLKLSLESRISIYSAHFFATLKRASKDSLL
jgi:hypothetical protein